MDAFESIIATILERQGYWVRRSVKVELTKAEKRQIGRPSSPRWELDVVGYKGRSNELLVVECKSYLDSRGVQFAGFSEPDAQIYKRFKLFNDEVLRAIVLKRLATQLVESGACRDQPATQLCLAAGHVASDKDRQQIKAHFDRRNWLFWDEPWLGEELGKIAQTAYQNDVASVAAKMVLRNDQRSNGSGSRL